MKMINNSGFTMPEVLIAMGLATMVTMTIGYVMTQVNQQKVQSQNLAENTSDELLVKKFVLKDLSHCASSFNTLIAPDDSGKGSFFDYIPDRPCIKSINESCERQFTLKEGMSFWMILSLNQNEQKPTIFEPGVADLNSDDHISDGEALSYLTNLKLNSPGGFLYFYSPIALRKTPTTAIPGLIFFLGQVTSGGIKSVPLPLQIQHPVLPNVQINSLDNMMFMLPMAGGPATVSLVRPVTLVRYSIKKNKLNRAVAVSFSDGSDPKMGADFLLANKVDKLIFKRKSISSPILSFEEVLLPTGKSSPGVSQPSPLPSPASS